MSEQKPATTILWFRRDLRLEDHPALCAAVRRGRVIPVFFWSPEEDGTWAAGSASRWWLHQSLTRLDESLRQRGSRLILRTGPVVAALSKLVDQTGAARVYWTRRYEPAARAIEQKVKDAMHARNAATTDFPGTTLFQPGTVRTQGNDPYTVFTPFWRRCMQSDESGQPERAPKDLSPPAHWPASVPLTDFRLMPAVDWAAGFRATWQPGEPGAQQRLRAFVKHSLRGYEIERDRPDHEGTSRLSPHLHFGEISPRQVFAAIWKNAPIAVRDAERYLTELGWREFAHHLLFHFPDTPEQPLRPAFARFPWSNDGKILQAWRKGRTGYPIVDAGMRQLWHTGWMHNRVRMIVASFLTKDLLLPWQEGAKWFWDTLVDADLSNNTLGWQWTAGCGADAAPYFRVFNPVTQGERFDPEGSYVRQWVPELAKVPTKFVHQPWTAPPGVLREAGVALGKNYPQPIVDHAEARLRALEAFKKISSHA
jgi:deoxyribodipyrimidine photo-lyase